MKFFRAHATVALLPLAALLMSLPGGAHAGDKLFPRRLVLSLDGVAWSTVHELQTRTENRCFDRFRPVGKMVSTYPSLSDIAWADLLRTPPPLGYQRYHYSIGKNAIVGGSLSDLGHPIDYEKRMHVAFTGVYDHLKTYMNPAKMAQVELDEVLAKFRDAGDLPDFHAYLLSTDSMQHTQGDINALLCWLSDELDSLSDEVKRESGRDLEILLLSDHGNNHRSGKLIDLRQQLREAGFHLGSRVNADKDVVFTTGGILTSVSVFAKPAALERIAAIALATEGVDIVSRIEGETSILVEGGHGGSARVLYDAKSDRFAYLPIEGDPLNYTSVIERATGRRFDAATPVFLDSAQWLAASENEWYPLAPERIWRGHHVITVNPAPLIISLKDGFEMTYGVVKAMSKIKKRGGTHGNLSAPASLGITLANYTDTPTLSTRQVSAFYDLSRFYNWQDHSRGGQFADETRFGERDFPADVFDDTNGPWALAPDQGAAAPVWINLWDPEIADWKALGLETSFEVKVTPRGQGTLAEKRDETITREIWARDLPSTPDGTEFRISIPALLDGREFTPGQYRVRVEEKKVDAATGKALLSRAMFKGEFILDLDGQVVVW